MSIIQTTFEEKKNQIDTIEQLLVNFNKELNPQDGLMGSFVNFLLALPEFNLIKSSEAILSVNKIKIHNELPADLNDEFYITIRDGFTAIKNNSLPSPSDLYVADDVVVFVFKNIGTLQVAMDKITEWETTLSEKILKISLTENIYASTLNYGDNANHLRIGDYSNFSSLIKKDLESLNDKEIEIKFKDRVTREEFVPKVKYELNFDFPNNGRAYDEGEAMDEIR